MNAIFSGRYNRAKYVSMMILVSIPFIAFLGFSMSEGMNIILYIFWFCVQSPFLVKRLHDLNKSGWYSLLFLIPIVNIPVGIYLLAVKGTEGTNRFGPDSVLQSIEQRIERAIRRLYLEAVKQESIGKYDEARALYNQVIQHFPFSEISADAKSCIEALEKKNFQESPNIKLNDR